MTEQTDKIKARIEELKSEDITNRAEKPKVCPIMSYKNPISFLSYCLKEECELWDTYNQGCTFKFR
jgi:hypothetical protein